MPAPRQPLGQLHGVAGAGFGALGIGYFAGNGAAHGPALGQEGDFGLGPGGEGFGQLVGQVYVVGVGVGREAHGYFLAHGQAQLLAQVFGIIR